MWLLGYKVHISVHTSSLVHGEKITLPPVVFVARVLQLQLPLSSSSAGPESGSSAPAEASLSIYCPAASRGPLPAQAAHKHTTEPSGSQLSDRGPHAHTFTPTSVSCRGHSCRL